jgi:hypothetical protein
MVAESDDALIEKYLEGEEITTDELIAAILVGVAEGRIFPIVCAAGGTGIGADRTLDLITEALPSPAQAAGATEDGPAVALCFKTLADQFSGGQPPGGRRGAAWRHHATCRAPAARVGSCSRSRARTTRLQRSGRATGVAKFQGRATAVTRRPAAFRRSPPRPWRASLSRRAPGRRETRSLGLRRMPTRTHPDVHRDEQTGGDLGALADARRPRRAHRAALSHDLPRTCPTARHHCTGEAEASHKASRRGQYGDCWVR